MGAPKNQTITQKTELDPVLKAHLYGGKLPAESMTGIVPAYLRPGGSIEGQYDNVEALYNPVHLFKGAFSDLGFRSDLQNRLLGRFDAGGGWGEREKGDGLEFADGGTIPSLSLAEQAYQLSAGTDLGAMLPEYEIADLSPHTQEGIDLSASGVGAYQPYLDTGTDTLGSGIGVLEGAGEGTDYIWETTSPFMDEGADYMRTGAEIARPSDEVYDPNAYLDYMNPYEQDVIDAAEADAARQSAILANEIGASAVGQGAYGGGREMVQRTEMARNLADNLLRNTSNLRQQGFQYATDTARGVFDSLQARRQGLGALFGTVGSQLGALGTSYGNLGLGLNDQAARIGMALGDLGSRYGDFGRLQSQLALQDINNMYTAGQIEQGHEQALLDAYRMNEHQRVMAPWQQTAFRADILSGSPTGVTSTMTTPGPSPISQALGMGIAGLGAWQSGIFDGAFGGP